jgi:glutathione S-transferase
MTVLYRCKAPTDLVCRCGKVARRLRSMGIDYQEVRVPFLKRDRPEVEDLTGQRWVPVLVHGEEVIHDSHRILEYLEWLEDGGEADDGEDAPRGGGHEAAPRALAAAEGAR